MSIPKKAPGFDQPTKEVSPPSAFDESSLAEVSESPTWEEMAKSRRALAKRLDSLLRVIRARRDSP
jgi:hypothetical protein